MKHQEHIEWHATHTQTNQTGSTMQAHGNKPHIVVCLFASKLQSDLKTTRFEEMKIDLEACRLEILRLRSEKEAPAKTTPRYVERRRFSTLL